tara:strand:+ start:3008 stop:3589 length:582 start_codon:yes stop_codon:yes gene_type:complete
VEDGDIVVPDDFNVNQREFVGEFNGYLDRDNLPQGVIGTSLIAAQTFTEVKQSTKEAVVTLSGNSIQFHELMSYSFNAEVDGLLTVDWSSNWEFSPSFSEQTTQTNSTVTTATTVTMDINGVQVGMIYRSSDARKQDAKVMYGALPVSAGNVTVTIRGRYFALNHADPKVMNVGDTYSMGFFRQILVMVLRKR